MRELPKIDPHHHLWDLKAVHYPWLSDRVEPKMWGDYASIRRDFLAEEYTRLARAESIVKSVHVQRRRSLSPTKPSMPMDGRWSH